MSNTSIIWPALDAKRFAVLLRTGPLTYEADKAIALLNMPPRLTSDNQPNVRAANAKFSP